MQALARGQGITEGLHEYYLPIPAKLRLLLFDTQARLNLSQFAQNCIEDAANFSKNVLRFALLKFFQPQLIELNFKDKRTEQFLQNFNDSVDTDFFPFLWTHLETESEERRKKWKSHLKEIAEKILEEVFSQRLLNSNLYYKSVLGAQQMFLNKAKKFS